nr:MAG TPA: hypothetical protein [Caudoviricetes sp.]
MVSFYFILLLITQKYLLLCETTEIFLLNLF